jgi:hypothetical protein
VKNNTCATGFSASPAATSLGFVPESKRRKPKNPQSASRTAQTAVKSKEPSPTWYVALMAGLMVVGVVLVLLRFVFEWDQTVLVAGLVAIAAGFLMTTNYR